MHKACVCASVHYVAYYQIPFRAVEEWKNHSKLCRKTWRKNLAPLAPLGDTPSSDSRKRNNPIWQASKVLTVRRVLLALGGLVVGVEGHPKLWRQDALVDFSTCVLHARRQFLQELLRNVFAIAVVSVDAVEHVFHLHTCIHPLAPAVDSQDF